MHRHFLKYTRLLKAKGKARVGYIIIITLGVITRQDWCISLVRKETAGIGTADSYSYSLDIGTTKITKDCQIKIMCNVLKFGFHQTLQNLKL